MQEGSPKFTDNSETPDPSGWSKFVSRGDIDNVVNSITSTLQGGFKNYFEGHDSTILAMLRGAGVWVFPGGKTFAFKDVYFSDHQDLVAHVTYVDPEQSTTFR